MSTKRKRASVRANLVKKYWANAAMEGREDLPTVSFPAYQRARREAWIHGMKVGFDAALRLARNESASLPEGK